MPSKSKKAPILKPSAEGFRYIRAEATKLLVEETKTPKGKFYGLIVDTHASLDTIEALLKLAGRASALIKIKVTAVHRYGGEVLDNDEGPNSGTLH